MRSNDNKYLFTRNNDINRMILNRLNDNDLISVCQTNTKASSLCADDKFWMLRIFSRFPHVPKNIFNKYKNGRKWSEYYIQDLRKINKTNAEEYLLSGMKNKQLDHVIISLNIISNSHDNYDRWINDHNQALVWASELGLFKVVNYLISQSANSQDSALISASRNGHLKIVQLLLSRNANIHSQNDSALILASKNGHLKVVQFLLSRNANIHAQDDLAVRMAHQNDHFYVVKYLISQGANIH